MVYLLYGEDNFLKEQFFKKIKKEFGTIENGINYIQMDEDSVKNIINDIETPAFGYEKKLIVVRNSNLFTKKNELAEKIASYLKDNDIEGNDIVFIEEKAEKNSLFNIISKKFTIKEFKELRLQDVINEVRRISNAYGVNIDANTANYFIECTGTNMQDIINELRKLIEYAGKNGTIKKEDIDALTNKKSESIIFDLTDNMGRRRVSESIDILHNLEYNKEPDQVILIMLYRHFKKLYITKLANGKNLIEYLQLKPNQTFLTNKYITQANYFKLDELKNLVFELINLDEMSKSGDIDLKIGLESVICKYCSNK